MDNIYLAEASVGGWAGKGTKVGMAFGSMAGAAVGVLNVNPYLHWLNVQLEPISKLLHAIFFTGVKTAPAYMDFVTAGVVGGTTGLAVGGVVGLSLAGIGAALFSEGKRRKLATDIMNDVAKLDNMLRKMEVRQNGENSLKFNKRGIQQMRNLNERILRNTKKVKDLIQKERGNAGYLRTQNVNVSPEEFAKIEKIVNDFQKDLEIRMAALQEIEKRGELKESKEGEYYVYTVENKPVDFNALIESERQQLDEYGNLAYPMMRHVAYASAGGAAVSSSTIAANSMVAAGTPWAAVNLFPLAMASLSAIGGAAIASVAAHYLFTSGKQKKLLDKITRTQVNVEYQLKQIHKRLKDKEGEGQIDVYTKDIEKAERMLGVLLSDIAELTEMITMGKGKSGYFRGNKSVGSQADVDAMAEDIEIYAEEVQKLLSSIRAYRRGKNVRRQS